MGDELKKDIRDQQENNKIEYLINTISKVTGRCIEMVKVTHKTDEMSESIEVHLSDSWIKSSR